MKRISPRYPYPQRASRGKDEKFNRPAGRGSWSVLGERGELFNGSRAWYRDGKIAVPYPNVPHRWAGLYDRSWRESHRVGKSRPGRRQRRGQSKPMGRGKR